MTIQKDIIYLKEDKVRHDHDIILLKIDVVNCSDLIKETADDHNDFNDNTKDMMTLSWKPLTTITISITTQKISSTSRFDTTTMLQH